MHEETYNIHLLCIAKIHKINACTAKARLYSGPIANHKAHTS